MIELLSDIPGAELQNIRAFSRGLPPQNCWCSSVSHLVTNLTPENGCIHSRIKNAAAWFVSACRSLESLMHQRSICWASQNLSNAALTVKSRYWHGYRYLHPFGYARTPPSIFARPRESFCWDFWVFFSSKTDLIGVFWSRVFLLFYLCAKTMTILLTLFWCRENPATWLQSGFLIQGRKSTLYCT